VVEEAAGEAHVPAQQPASGQAAWIPPSDVDPGRSRRAARSSGQGSASAVGLIWRVRGRRGFEALRRTRRRARSGPVRVAFAPDPPDASLDPPPPPRVAYAVGRKVGSAAVRNRVRRRLRAVMAEAARRERLPSGSYLVGVTPEIVPMSFEEVQHSVFNALQRLEVSASRTDGATRTADER
jgi:ribonuclease P protein component